MTCSHVFKEKREVTYLQTCKLCGLYEKDVELAEARAALAPALEAYDRAVIDGRTEADRLLRELGGVRADLNAARSALEACTKANDDGTSALTAERAAHERTRRAVVVELLTKRGRWSLSTWLQTVEAMPAEIRELCGAHAGKPIGKCNRCGAPAPLNTETLRMAGAAEDESWQVCAWNSGCAPKVEP